MKTYTCDKPMAAKRGLAGCQHIGSEKCKTCHCCIIDDGVSRYHYSEQFYPRPEKKTKKGVPIKPLKKWTEEDTTIMVGLYEDGMHYKKIAAQMDRSESAVYNRLKRMGKLKRMRRTTKGG